MCSTSANRMSLQSIQQNFLNISRCPNFNNFFSSLWILSCLNLLNPYIFISRECSCGGELPNFHFKNRVHGWCYGDNRKPFWSKFYLCTYTDTWLKRTHRTCHLWICKTGTSLPLLAEYWQISSTRKLNCSGRRYNISMQVSFFKKAHLSDSVCFHDKINFLEATITQGSEVYHSTRTLSPDVYRCFTPTKQKIVKKILGYIKRKA